MLWSAAAVTEPARKPPKVAEDTIGRLRDLVLSGAYAPGDKLPPERQLAAQLGVNRSSLREALKRLEQLGLVRARRGDGTRVLDFMRTAGLELAGHLVLRGSPDILRDMLELRVIYGREVARMAAERASDEDLAALEAITAKVGPSADPAVVLATDFEFYVALTDASKNRVFRLLINSIRSAVTAYSGLLAPLVGPAEDVRASRYNRAERAALKAPLKILFPLVFCIMPCVALIVGAPIFIQFSRVNPMDQLTGESSQSQQPSGELPPMPRPNYPSLPR